MNYLLLKQIHLSLAALSIGGFVLRWIWRMLQSPLAMTRWARIVPHVVDTVFLATAVLLSSMAGPGSMGAAWFSAKIIGLVLYILLGMVAMRSAPAAKSSVPAFIAAVVVFGWIVTVAVTKSPLGWLQPG
jgi:uncharacterized membrane protein SirB2